MTEPDLPASNPTWLDTRAERTGDEYVINGRKWFTSSADGAAFAIVMAVTDPDAPPHARASQIIVPTDTPGFRTRPQHLDHGRSRARTTRATQRSLTKTAASRSTNLLGPENAGFLIAQERLGPGRIHHAMRWIGIAERAFDLDVQAEPSAASRAGAKARAAADGPAVDRREPRARSMRRALRAPHRVANRDRRLRTMPATASARIKFYVADVLTYVLDRAIQIHGALGMTDETVLVVLLSARARRSHLRRRGRSAQGGRSRSASSPAMGFGRRDGARLGARRTRGRRARRRAALFDHLRERSNVPSASRSPRRSRSSNSRADTRTSRISCASPPPTARSVSSFSGALRSAMS